MQCIDPTLILEQKYDLIRGEIQTEFSQEILMHSMSSSSVPDQLSSWAAAARWRGGEGCSLTVAHQIGRSTISNILGNSWGLPIHLLMVVWILMLKCGQRFAPPSWDRLDRPHCTSMRNQTLQLTEIFINLLCFQIAMTPANNFGQNIKINLQSEAGFEIYLPPD